MGRRSRNESFHDRWSGRYDESYSGSDYWRLYRALTWRHLKPHLPRRLPARALDLGCGTGEWGLRLLKSGFEVSFVDLSRGMLERTRKKVEEAGDGERASFLKADLSDLAELEPGAFAFATAQGDPLSLCASPLAALRGIRRALAPNGVLVASVDARPASVDAYFEKDDFKGLLELVRSGRSEFLTRRKEERFPTHAFDLDELERLAARSGFEPLDVIGKPVLPLRRYPAWLADPGRFRELQRLEESLHRKPGWIGRASHLQFAWRRSD